MQDLQGVTAAEFKASVQSPKAKFEILTYPSGVATWIDLTNLGAVPIAPVVAPDIGAYEFQRGPVPDIGAYEYQQGYAIEGGVNYLKSFSMSLGGASMTPDPVAGTWSATIDNPDGMFYPENTESAYCDYFVTGRKVRISVGGTFAGVDKYWQRLIGVMDSPRFGAEIGGEVQLKGMDYFQYLADFKLKSPDNYWGDVAVISTLDPVESLGAEIYAENDALEVGAGEANNITNWGAPAEITLSVEADAGGGSTYVMKAVLGSAPTATVETFTTPGDLTWTCPDGVMSIDVEAWGGGGGGGGTVYPAYGGGGGGGGAYSKKTSIAVTPGQTYAFKVGAGGLLGWANYYDGYNGEDSYFIDLLTVLAKGGQGGQYPRSGIGPNGISGYGGAAASGVGDTKYSGGDGGGGTNNGSGGGSSAGTGAAGGSGGDASASYGGVRGIAPAGGTDGGDGGNAGLDGQSAPGNGGGGGGAGRDGRGGGDGAGGKVVVSYTIDGAFASPITNIDIGNVTAGTKYKVTLKYNISSGATPSLTAGIYVGAIRQGEASALTSTAWPPVTIYFTATDSGAAKVIFDLSVPSGSAEFEFDQISLKEVSSIGILPRYALPADCTGVYYVTLNGTQIWYGVDPNGWFYDAEHNEIYFSPNSTVVAGTNNLIVYYHTAQIPLYVVADILVDAGLYATRAEALAAMIYNQVGPSIDRVWFEAGTSALAAITMLCERCNFRFYFAYDGAPVFIPESPVKAAGAEDFAFEQNHIASPERFDDASELFNSINIEGEKISQPIGLDQTMPSNYKGSDSDAASIAAYGEKTKSISNYLFQSDAACAAMATALLAAFKDGKKHLSFNTEFFPAPLELGDTVRAQVRLASGSGALWGTFHWSDGTLWGSNGTVIVHRGKIRDIKIDNFGTTHILELAE
jgi:hypothetical protein